MTNILDISYILANMYNCLMANSPGTRDFLKIEFLKLTTMGIKGAKIKSSELLEKEQEILYSRL